MPGNVALVILASVSLLAVPAYADTLTHDLNVFLNSPVLSGSVTGCLVEDAHTGQVLYAHNPDVRLIPASNRKLFTSAAALELLGDDYTLKTRLLADAKPDADGAIQGNLYLKGGGDGLISPVDLAAFSDTLVKSGVKHIAGDVIGDATIFKDDPYPEGWGVDYLADDYAAQIAGLEVAEGVVTVSVTGAATAGEKPIVTLDPPTAYIPVENDAVTDGTAGGASLKVTRPYNQNLLVITGQIAVSDKSFKPIGITVDNPPLYAATVLLETLRRAGITVDGVAKMGKTPAGVSQLALHTSLPLSQYIVKMNKPSDNLLAESLVRIMGVEKGKAGSYEEGDRVETTFFRSLGIQPTELIFADGSGVTRLDQVTPRAVLKLLVGMAKKLDFKSYYVSLPIGGVDGTLKHRMKKTLAYNNVHAKTGTVRFCHTLSGYVTDRSGRLLAFSLLNNNFAAPVSEVNQIQDAIAARLANLSEPRIRKLGL